MSSSPISVSTPAERFIGRVKWFNNKTGYGFVTVTDGPKSGTDIFVHHSSIKVDSEQYKYLVQGEYVEFTLSETKTGDHEIQAGEVSGIKGGKLMCETRHEVRTSRYQYASTKESSGDAETPRAPRASVRPRPKAKAAPHRESAAPRANGQGPRGDGEWTYVAEKKPIGEAKRARGRPPKVVNKEA
jgi:CspA family cold shock protein